MKLFLKHDITDISSRFVIFDESGNEKYIVTGKSGSSKQIMYISDMNDNKVSLIAFLNFVGRYFSVKCEKRLYALIPCVNEHFGFMIYGSTFRFIGDIAAGSFSLIDVDKSPVMTQKKCWGKVGEGFEINIFDDEYEILALSVAVCAAIYISLGQENPVPT